MNQPIFNKPKLINPRTLLSWKHTDLECKIYRLAELFLDFDFHKYRSHACIIGLENPIFMSHTLSKKILHTYETMPCSVRHLGQSNNLHTTNMDGYNNKW